MEFDNLKSDLQAIIDSALIYAKSLDSQAEFDIYLHYQSKSKVGIDQGVVNSSDGVVAGNAVRVVTGPRKEKKISFTSSSGIDLNRVKVNIKEAISLNNAINVTDPRFQSFPDPHSVGKEGVFSDDILSTATADLVPAALSLMEEAKIDSRIKTISVSQEISYGGFAIGNTNGINNASRMTIGSSNIYCQAVDGEERKDCYEQYISRENIPNMEGKGIKASNKALKLLGGQMFKESITVPTIWDNIASACFIRAGIGSGINGGPIVDGRSPLRDKIGEEVANPSFSLYDDGQKPTAIYTHACDAEGVPQRKTPIVENGVLKSFIFNHYYSQIFGTESTGNCTRGGGIFPQSLPYESTPAIVGTNYVVKSSLRSQEELLSEIDGKAVLIHEMPLGIFHSSVATGEFSAVANAAFLIENGEIITPLKSASVAGSFYKGLKDIRAIGSNSEVTSLGVETPWLVIDGFSLVI
jgi:PmbA protein